MRGDVVLPYTQVTETGITIHHTYPYRQLYVYNHMHRVVLELTSVTAARRYFERFNSDYTNGCPPFGGESERDLLICTARGSSADGMSSPAWAVLPVSCYRSRLSTGITGYFLPGSY